MELYLLVVMPLKVLVFVSVRVERKFDCLVVRLCSGARTGKDGRKHASGSQTSKCLGNKIRDSQDPGGFCGIRPRILRLERLVGRQQCGGFGSGQTLHGVHERAFSEFHRAWKGETLLANAFFFFPTLSQLQGIDWLPIPQRKEKGVSEFFETTAPGGSLERSGR